MGRWAGPGLANTWVQAEIAHELARVLKAVDVADRCEEARGDDHVHAGHTHQPPDLRRLERGLGDQPLDLGDLAVEELDLAHAAIDGLALLGSQLQPREPSAAFHAEQVAHR